MKLFKNRERENNICIYKECIANCIDKIDKKASSSKVGSKCAKKIIEKWLKFIDFQDAQIKPSDDTVLLYKLLNQEFDKLSGLLDFDKDFYYLNLQLVLLINIFENYVSEPDLFNETYIYKLNDIFRHAEKVTKQLFETKDEIKRISSLILSEKEKKLDLEVVDRSIDGNRIELNNIKNKYEYLNKAYLMICHQVSICNNDFEKIFDIIVSSKNSIDEYSQNNIEYAKKIDEIFDSTIIIPDEPNKKKSDDISIDDTNPNLLYLLEKVDSISEKIDSISEKIDVNTDKLESVIKNWSNSSTKSIIEEFSKLDFGTLSNQIAELYKLLDSTDAKVKKDIEKVDNAIVASQVALANNDVNLKSYIESLFANGVSMLKLSSAYACIRGLIDSYCRFVHGYQLNRDQRPFDYEGKYYDAKAKKEVEGRLDQNFKIFQQCFNLAYCDTVGDIYSNSNTFIHIAKEKMADLEDAAKKALEQATFLTDIVGIDFNKIDFKAGAEKLLKQELEWQPKLQNLIDQIEQTISDPCAANVKDLNKLKKEKKSLEKKMDQLNERIENYRKFIGE